MYSYGESLSFCSERSPRRRRVARGGFGPDGALRAAAEAKRLSVKTAQLCGFGVFLKWARVLPGRRPEPKEECYVVVRKVIIGFFMASGALNH